MSLAWAAYSVVVALLLGVAARAAEAGLRLAGRPGRWPWVAAPAGSWLLSLRALAEGRAAAPDPAVAVVAASGGRGLPAPAPEPGILAVLAARIGEGAETLAGTVAGLVPGPGALAAAEPWVGAVWAASSGAALLLVGLAVARLLRASRRWPEARVLDEPVRLSPSFGPAVLGVVRPRIVLPRWALSLGEAPLRLVLDHEREHRRARDTLVLGLGALAALAAPWNLPLWWHLRRLRVAVELDCDRRVLARGVSPRAYGALLVEVGERVGRVGIPAVALSEQSSFLERRLRMITKRRSERWGWRAAGAAALTAGVVAVACETPAPTSPPAPTPTGAMEAVAERPDGERTDRAPAGTVTARFRAVELPSDPLLIVDGVVVADRGLAELRALDLASVEVVRGPEAVERYGERARGGVIIVTTRTAAGPAASGERTVAPSDHPASTGRLRRDRSGDLSDKQPLVVVDGVITPLSPADLDPEDIRRVEVVKGGAARALYGERAAGGLVRIETEGGGERARYRLREMPADTVRADTLPADTLDPGGR